MVSSGYAEVLKQKRAILQGEEQLIRNARIFYEMGFNHSNLAKSQMMAVYDKLQASASINVAKQNTAKFIGHQLDKLREKEERTGKRKSWLIDGPLKDRELGEILIDWINNGKYTEGLSSETDSDSLSLLRQFWNHVLWLYRYEKVFGKGMPLQEDNPL